MTTAEKKSAILVIVTGFVALYLFYQIERFMHIALIVGLGSLISKKFTNVVVYVWEKLGEKLGWLNSRIILSVIFYLFLFPIALLSRLSNKDPLQLKKTSSKSLFKERNHRYAKKDLENIW